MTLSLTPRSNRVIQHANKVAEHFGHGFIGTDHLLIGLIRENYGAAGRILAENNITEEMVLKALGFYEPVIDFQI